MPTNKASLALILIALLVIPTRLVLAQQTPAAPATQPTQAPPPVIDNLKIIVLEGDGTINNIETRAARVPIVEIRDDNDKPVESAEVVFRLPATGPGGAFPGQKNTKTAKTNSQGQAAATGFVPNNQSGRFDIQITAASGNRIGQKVISQTNATGVHIQPEKKSKVLGLGWKKLAIISGVAAGVIVGVVIATRGSSNSTITITPGPVTIGGR